MTEAEVLQKIDQAVRLLAHNFVFGYFDLDDIRQEARIFALDALERYDPQGYNDLGEPNRKLENFLFAHIRNRLLNLLRNKYRRNDPPCNLCHQGRHAEHEDRQVCQKYKEWKVRNTAKANLARPLDLSTVADEHERNMHAESDVEDQARVREATGLIDHQLPVDLRADYLRMKSGERLTKNRRLKVEVACREILKDFLTDEKGTAE